MVADTCSGTAAFWSTCYLYTPTKARMLNTCCTLHHNTTHIVVAAVVGPGQHQKQPALWDTRDVFAPRQQQIQWGVHVEVHGAVLVLAQVDEALLVQACGGGGASGADHRQFNAVAAGSTIYLAVRAGCVGHAMLAASFCRLPQVNAAVHATVQLRRRAALLLLAGRHPVCKRAHTHAHPCQEPHLHALCTGAKRTESSTTVQPRGPGMCAQERWHSHKSMLRRTSGCCSSRPYTMCMWHPAASLAPVGTNTAVGSSVGMVSAVATRSCEDGMALDDPLTACNDST